MIKTSPPSDPPRLAGCPAFLWEPTAWRCKADTKRERPTSRCDLMHTADPPLGYPGHRGNVTKTSRPSDPPRLAGCAAFLWEPTAWRCKADTKRERPTSRCDLMHAADPPLWAIPAIEAT